METLKKGTLINIEENRGNKELIIMCEENGIKTAHTIKLSKKIFDNGDYIESESKAKFIDETCNNLFNCTFDDLKIEDVCGQIIDFYEYNTGDSIFNSLYPVSTIKLLKDKCVNIGTLTKGKSYNGVIIAVDYNPNNGIRLIIEVGGNTETPILVHKNYTYGTWWEAEKEFVRNTTTAATKLKSLRALLTDEFTFDEYKCLENADVEFTVKTYGKVYYIELDKIVINNECTPKMLGAGIE